MGKVGTVAAGISAVVGVIGANMAAGALLAGATVTAGTATALAFGLPIAGAVIGISMADRFLANAGPHRTSLNLLVSATLAVVGMSLVSAVMGVGTLVAGISLAPEAFAAAGTAATMSEPVATTLALSVAASIAGTGLGSIMGVAVGETLTRKR